MSYVFIDTDIFVRSLRYTRDEKRSENEQLIELMKRGELKAATSIYNVLETCGVLSFNLSLEDINVLYQNFCTNYQIKVFAQMSPEGDWIYPLEKIFNCICNKQSLGDAFVKSIVESFSNQLSAFVTWNAKHFTSMTVPVMTPKEYIKKIRMGKLH